MRKVIVLAAAAGVLLAGIVSAAVFGGLRSGASSGASSRGAPFAGPLTHISEVASTVPVGGDLNPYGTAVVPDSRGDLTAGDVLVSNFSNAANQQGRGTTIVEVSPGGRQRLFAKIPADSVPGGVGLTTALVVLRAGWVIVGSLPAADGTPATMKPGELSCSTRPAMCGKRPVRAHRPRMRWSLAPPASPSARTGRCSWPTP